MQSRKLQPLGSLFAEIKIYRKICDLEAISYDFVKLKETTKHSDLEKRILITIYNPYRLKIRPEKQIAAVLGLSRSQTKNFMAQEKN